MTTMSEELQTQLLTAPDALRELEPEWNELLQASAVDNVFLTWEWMSSWTQWLGEACELRLWTVRRVRDNRLLGIAPLAKRRRRLPGGIPYRELILLGSEPAGADHVDFIVHRDAQIPVAMRLRDCFAETQRECDLVSLEGLAPDSPALGPWLSGLPWWTRQQRVPAPYVELPATWDAYLRGLQRNVRAGINRCGRALSDEVHPAPVVYRRIAREDELDHGIDELFRLHQATQNAQGHPGSFADPGMASFHRDVARRFLRRGWLYLTLLTVAERPIAAIYIFVYAGKYWAYSTGYDQEWHRFGPGRQVMAQAMRDAIQQGVSQFDLLRGGESYKRLLTDRSRPLVFVQAPVSALGMLVLGTQAATRAGSTLARRVRNKTRKLLNRDTTHADKH